MKTAGGIIHQSRPEIDNKPNLPNSHLAAYYGYCLILFVQVVSYTWKMND